MRDKVRVGQTKPIFGSIASLRWEKSSQDKTHQARWEIFIISILLLTSQPSNKYAHSSLLFP